MILLLLLAALGALATGHLAAAAVAGVAAFALAPLRQVLGAEVWNGMVAFMAVALVVLALGAALAHILPAGAR